ncbi:MAG: DUF4091 domain-containing protein [Ruminococcaceae bacterium]|nr:DUF4091 domain-containing protein [Oscillospiraceae bacterium]
MNELYTVCAEEKVQIDKKPKMLEKENTMARDETLSFQLVYKIEWLQKEIEVKIKSPIKKYITYRQVEYVPCTTPVLGKGDDYYLTKKPFFCPDVLCSCEKRKPTARLGCYNSIWFTVNGDLTPGEYPIEISLEQNGYLIGKAEYKITVLDFYLGKSSLMYTNWFHYDSIAQYYNLKVFSPRYNKIMYDFISCAVRHGMNMLLTPMFTPPLDTRQGKERLTVQLVDVTKTDKGYEFDFKRLVSFMKKAKELGIEYFEMSHLFTQWGAKAAPKIVAKVDGKLKRIFGWNTPATGKEYEEFLGALLPKLTETLKREGLYQSCRFHISDEPNEQCLESYKAAKAIFKKYAPDANVMDALSHYEFYAQGLVDTAISSSAHIQTFLDNKTPDLWVYYCCAETDSYLSNRYMSMPGERIRVLGMQMYLNDIKGFLHWGYNFYNSVLSDEAVDPYLITDAGGGLQSGDCFCVYPGKDGALDSVRFENFYDGIQDYKLFKCLENKIGREEAEKLLLDNGFKKTFTDYPHSIRALKKIRRLAQKAICS